jgi:hypothetical protein
LYISCPYLLCLVFPCVEGVAEINKPKCNISPCAHNTVCTKLAHRSGISTDKRHFLQRWCR